MDISTLVSPIGKSLYNTSVAALHEVNDRVLSSLANPSLIYNHIASNHTVISPESIHGEKIFEYNPIISSSMNDILTLSYDFSSIPTTYHTILSGLSYVSQQSQQIIYFTTNPTITHIEFTKYLSQHPYPSIDDLYDDIPITILSILFVILCITCITKILLTLYDILWKTHGTGVYILDASTFNGWKPEWKVSSHEWILRGQTWFHMHTDDIHFTNGILDRSGIGPNTHFPPGIATFPPDLSLDAARDEAKIVMFNCIDQLLMNNNIQPQDIDILVTNCSLFNPTPSLCAMIINHYKLRHDIICYNLGGMGCSASPIAINAASTSLLLHPKKHPIAVVVSMENITQNVYMGREKSLMLANALFRLGGAAILLTRDNIAVYNRPKPKWSIDYLTHIHTASNTDSYTCVFQDIDKEQKQGVRLDKSLMAIAAVAISKNMNTIGPKLLPWTAKLDYAYRYVLKWIITQGVPKIHQYYGQYIQQPIRFVQHWMIIYPFTLVSSSLSLSSSQKTRGSGRGRGSSGDTADSPTTLTYQKITDKNLVQSSNNKDNTVKQSVQPQAQPQQQQRNGGNGNDEIIPNFKLGVNHFALHAGGRGVLDAIQQTLKLSDADIKPSRDVLHKVGNTSSSSIWFEYKEIESTRRIYKGDILLAIAVGSGFKCNTLVLRRI